MTNIEFIKLHSPAEFPCFSDLPIDSQQAIRVYCEEGFELEEEFLKHISNYSFLVAEIPTDICTEAVMNRDGGELHGDFYEYNGPAETWINAVDHGNSRWPCILSNFDDELLQDGWHRFYGYIKAGHSTIKVLAFIQR